MIVNGGSYRNVRWWADHLQAKENDRTCVVESYGLRSETIHQMLSEMEGFAQGTRCENFFYQMNLNPRGDERLTEEQWTRAREIAEKHHGLEGQAYFVVEHVKNGRAHHHVIWSRIDLENMRAISDSKDARKNHAIAREVEQEFDLQRVTGPYDREPGTPRPKRAPEPWEMYRGMKTGLDPRDITAEVTELFHRCDSGKAFQAALEQHGYMLLKGDRRGFVILDSAGKEHSLARRIDGVNTKDINAFMNDVNREALPTVEQGKARHQDLKITGLKADRATVQHAIAWEEELAKAAIEKETTERRFVEKGQGGEAAGKEIGGGGSPFEPLSVTGPPHPQLNRTSPEFWFGDVAKDNTRDHRPVKAPDELRGTAAQIWMAYNRSHNANTFAGRLEEHGILLASATKEEADRSHREAAFAKEIGRFAPVFREREIVAVGESGHVYKLSQRNTGTDRARVENFMKKLDRPLLGIEATKQVMHERAEAREAYAKLASIVHPVKPRVIDPRPTGRLGRVQTTPESTINARAALGKTGRAAGKVMESISGAVESLFAPRLTPEQKREGEITTQRRQAETEQKIDFTKYTGELAQARQEQEREATVQRQPDQGRER